VLRGRLHALRGLRAMLRQRREIQRRRKGSWRDLDAWIIKRTPWCESLRRNLRNAFTRQDSSAMVP
jgi:hypothetical protein